MQKSLKEKHEQKQRPDIKSTTSSNQELVCPLTKYSQQSYPLLKSMTVCRDNQGLKMNLWRKCPKNRRILIA